MKRLGYAKFVAQGGDWGAVIVDLMGLQAPPELLGIHTNMAGIFTAEIDKAASSGAPSSSGLSADEAVAYERTVRLLKGNRLRVSDGAAPSDALWNRRFSGDILDNITITWLTNTDPIWRASLLGVLGQRVFQC